MTDNEQQEIFDFLVNRFGADEDEAKRLMRDDDLWLLGPDLRLGLPDEEALEEWRKACHALGDMVEMAEHIGLGAQVCIMDAQHRAQVALEWTQERVRQAQE